MFADMRGVTKVMRKRVTVDSEVERLLSKLTVGCGAVNKKGAQSGKFTR